MQDKYLLKVWSKFKRDYSYINPFLLSIWGYWLEDLDKHWDVKFGRRKRQ